LPSSFQCEFCILCFECKNNMKEQIRSPFYHGRTCSRTPFVLFLGMMIPCLGSRSASVERSIVFLVAFGLVRVIPCIYCIYIYSFECKKMKEQL
jgi:hypothetical protein